MALCLAVRELCGDGGNGHFKLSLCRSVRVLEGAQKIALFLFCMTSDQIEKKDKRERQMEDDHFPLRLMKACLEGVAYPLGS